ncbi:MAG: four helix bundle protein [Balneolaceae bacterium]|nr:four helix bundle protein [Balneolaceae bacterium]
MKENVILNKTYTFAVRIVRLHSHLCETKKQFEIAKQLLRSGTSIGANTEEAIGAESKKDFIHKFSIAYKEACETKYWLRLLRDSEIIDNKLAVSLIDDCEQILAIIGKIKITSRKHS